MLVGMDTEFIRSAQESLENDGALLLGLMCTYPTLAILLLFFFKRSEMCGFQISCIHFILFTLFYPQQCKSANSPSPSIPGWEDGLAKSGDTEDCSLVHISPSLRSTVLVRTATIQGQNHIVPCLFVVQDEVKRMRGVRRVIAGDRKASENFPEWKCSLVD